MIRVAQPEDGSDWPQVTFMVDGTDRLKHAARPDFQGFSAMELLVDANVLLPAAEARRVALYVCSCGEAGCGSRAPVISADEDRVAWTDFQDYTAVFKAPLRLDDPYYDPFSDGTPAGVPDLVFDRLQYEAEVARAVADRSWESDARRFERLLLELLHESEDGRLHEAGLELNRVWSEPAKKGLIQVTVDLDTTVRRPERGSRQQILLDVKVAPDSPERMAAEVAAKLAAVPVEQWGSTFRWRFRR